MPRTLADYRLFLREFRRTFHTTGAILPSSPGLARALVRYIDAEGGPKRILEVGPGTGSVTSQIVARMGPADQLDLVELNDRFVEHLQERFSAEVSLAHVAPRTRIIHAPVEQLDQEAIYDTIISGLPLNNFSHEIVESILGTLQRLIKPGGTLSFFEYIAVRRMRTKVGRRDDRRRLRSISRTFDALFQDHEIRRDWIWLNVPPAWVHHLRFAD